MDDDFIQKLYQLLFISEDYEEFKDPRKISEKFKKIRFWLYNPYNAYRFIDLVLFNILSIV